MTADPPAVHRIEFEVDWTPGHVAAYLLAGEQTVLFDAGTPGEAAHDELTAGLDAAGYAPANVDHLVITHPHIDHIGQTQTLVEAGATLHAPASVRRRFARDPDDLATVVTANARAAGTPEAQVDSAVEMSVRSLTRNRKLLAPDAVDDWVEPGDSVSIDDLEFDAIHAPGHQADHLCFETTLGGERVIFSGDMAIEPFRPVALHVGLDREIGDTIPAFYEALDRLSTREVDTVYPGHGPVHDDFAGAVGQSRRSLDRLEERVLEMLADGAETAVDVAARRSAEGRDLAYLLPESLGMLQSLERDGAVVSSVSGDVRRYEPAN
ncbi:MBL fold metallo-hydrolase [Haladaptatus sp. DYSN1]|uniref:MBL fold metallo-hydrolase n=1 Tax=unclassified Haladaptatus TaxID=2622732 RepID=UPI002406D2B5|nr:MBL fold metallo-hydrolase [Haladaptatus sp. DYSN1]